MYIFIWPVAVLVLACFVGLFHGKRSKVTNDAVRISARIAGSAFFAAAQILLWVFLKPSLAMTVSKPIEFGLMWLFVVGTFVAYNASFYGVTTDEAEV